MTNKELKKRFDEGIKELEKLVKFEDKRITELGEEVAYLYDLLRIKPKQNHDFKVGDRVQFKSWEEMEKEYGLNEYNGNSYINICPCFTKDMIYLCGEFATINGFTRDRFVLLKDFSIKNKDNEFYSYSITMLKPVTDEPKCKFKVGDKVEVKVKNDERLNDKKGKIINVSEKNCFVKFDDKKLGVIWASEDSLEPYTEPRWTFTDDEKVILRNLPDEYKWIARNKNNTIVISSIEPEKDSRGLWWDYNLHASRYLHEFNHLFQSIKWEDTEACEFRKFI